MMDSDAFLNSVERSCGEPEWKSMTVSLYIQRSANIDENFLLDPQNIGTCDCSFILPKELRAQPRDMG